MGSSESASITESNPKYDISNGQVNSRLQSDRSFSFEDIADEFLPPKSIAQLTRYGFAGTWSRHMVEGDCPVVRTNNFSVISKDLNSIFIGYGVSENNEILNDIWQFNLETQAWRNIPLSGEIPAPRYDSTAAINGSTLFIFGGKTGNMYLDDLHTVDIETGVVNRIITSGDLPEPRSSPLMAIYDHTLFLWGGFNESWPTNLYTFDIDTNVWHSIDCGIGGRAYIPTAVVDGCLLGYGCSKSGGFVRIDFSSSSVSILKADGLPPPSNSTAAGMVQVDHFLLYFGGRPGGNYSQLFACDLLRMRWFPFYVVPDEETVSIADGDVSETGCFLLPRQEWLSLGYSEQRRELCAVLGSPGSPLASTISMAEPLAILHLRDDMLDMLVMCTSTSARKL